MQSFNELINIDELEDFMINNRNIAKINISSDANNGSLSQYIIKKTQEKMTPPKKNISTISDIFFPKQRDMLFWCFYIINNELDEDHLQIVEIQFDPPRRIAPDPLP